MRTKLKNYLALLLVLFAQLSFAQQRTVSGTVTDNNGLPLPGVSIVVKGNATGTQTDLNGTYSIQAAPTDVLVYSFVGMLPKEMPATTTTVNAVLVEDAIVLEGVVVTAFGIKRNP